MKRPPSFADEFFGPRKTEVKPLLDRMAQGEGSGTGGGWFGAAGEAAVRSLFAPPPAAAPPPPPSPGEDPEVRRVLAELRAEAEEAGVRSAEGRVQAVIDKYLDAIRQLGERTLETRPQAAEVVSLAMMVAREILGRELSVDGEPIVTALDEALRQVGTHPQVVVRLSREDLEYVKRRRPDLGSAGIELVLDETLGAGGCIVEAPDQIVDASIEARLAAARDAVAAALDRDHESNDDDDDDGRSEPPHKETAC